MAEVFVARQPIFTRTLDVAGYELLFRDGQASRALVADPEGATASVVLNSFTEIGLERLVGTKPAWVNVSREFVLSGLARTLPPNVVGLEILEDELLDERFVHALIELKRRGYRLALDDFEYTVSAERLLRLVDVVKLDVLAMGRDRMSREVARLRPYGATLLAEKVETHEDHAWCVELGCDLFQGFFFCRPELLHNRGIVATRASMLEVVSDLQDPTVQLGQLERKISRDVALSFRLLRYINSAFFGLRFEISSIGQALALLGVENLRRWATLTVLATVDGKPPELTVTALVRARFCELAGEQLPGPRPGELFTLGLFSVIDALMDAPIEDVVAQIPFPPDMRYALVHRAGEKGVLLESVTALEAGDFDRAQRLVRGAGDLYLQALMWAGDAAGPLFGEAPAMNRRPHAA
ncbi:MAG TPA: HDOD domain-containing protein [Solirubrobacteraceae bacterium]|nr:HDOD domain-containing protein [Solirubrobacteraceae bacterium]